LLLLTAAVLAGLVLFLSWSRLQASLNYLPVQSAIELYWINGEVPEAQLVSLQNRTLQSINLHPHQRYWEGLSLLHYLQAIQPDNSLSARREAYENTVSAATASLAMAPVQPQLWLRKAHALNWLSFTPAATIQAFKMSIYTGRVEPMLLIPRLVLGYTRVNAMDEEGRSLLRDQTLLAWRLRQRDVLRAIRQESLSFPQISILLSPSHTDVLAEMEEALAGRVR
jgi:hypothetical protein